MKKLTLPLLTFTFASLSVRADTNLAALKSHAEQVHLESQSIKQMLKQKAPDLNVLRQKVDQTKEGINKIQGLVSQIESENPTLASTETKAWEEIKTRASVLGVMHGHKEELASEEGLRKKRALLRAHVEGVAIRAVKLQESVEQLEKKARRNP